MLTPNPHNQQDTELSPSEDDGAINTASDGDNDNSLSELSLTKATSNSNRSGLTLGSRPKSTFKFGGVQNLPPTMPGFKPLLRRDNDDDISDDEPSDRNGPLDLVSDTSKRMVVSSILNPGASKVAASGRLNELGLDATQDHREHSKNLTAEQAIKTYRSSSSVTDPVENSEGPEDEGHNAESTMDVDVPVPGIASCPNSPDSAVGFMENTEVHGDEGFPAVESSTGDISATQTADPPVNPDVGISSSVDDDTTFDTSNDTIYTVGNDIDTIETDSDDTDSSKTTTQPHPKDTASPQSQPNRYNFRSRHQPTTTNNPTTKSTTKYPMKPPMKPPAKPPRFSPFTATQRIIYDTNSAPLIMPPAQKYKGHGNPSRVNAPPAPRPSPLVRSTSGTGIAPAFALYTTPPTFTPWSPATYAALATALSTSSATAWVPAFAAAHGKSVDEVRCVFDCAVLAPLQNAGASGVASASGIGALAHQSVQQRVEAGIRDRADAWRACCTPSRLWCRGGEREVEGVMVGVSAWGEVCVEVGREGGTERERVKIAVAALTGEDWRYLYGACGGEDMACLLMGMGRPGIDDGGEGQGGMKGQRGEMEE
ncbi:uncharacterized protein K452DRAFT_345746 [Aplosporella prunicola CBS 121167]|uniref:Uncharacterized protein n=1 Tax=Aplosporella prunicola CBS 121167 TaxID=1176127 RepID=A0A6A6BJF9_9PEZI|nr:uncharacterized protein K452DRAFT_345746 [Aplosporella prunicola CBS 121167]KAF2144252.1 hypothetical protein K452DRAFT_345746 [Aplosporella prunicola CBS 121167]